MSIVFAESDTQDDVASSWERLVGSSPQVQSDLATPPSTSLAVFDPIQSGLAELRRRYGNVAFDLRTVKGNDEARQARKALVSLRSRTDEAYSNWNAPILEQQKAARSLRDSIKAEIQKIEAPIDEQIKADEARREADRRAKEEAEAARLSAIRARLGEIGSAAASVSLADAAQIEAKLQWLTALELTEEAFSEFLSDAQSLRAKAVADTEALLAARRARDEEAAQLERVRLELDLQRKQEAERIAAERAEFERQQAEERARIQAEREELARLKEEHRLAAEAAQRERERAEGEARAAEAARAAAAAEDDLIGRTLECVEPAPAPLIPVLVVKAPPAPPPPEQEDAFAEELQQAKAERPSPVEQDRPADRELTLAIAERFGVKQVTAAVWLSNFDAIAEIDRAILEGL